MSEILKFVLVDADGVEGDYEYDDCQEAIKSAGTTHAVIQRTYTYDDSELVWTPNGRHIWPPKRASRTTRGG